MKKYKYLTQSRKVSNAEKPEQEHFLAAPCSLLATNDDSSNLAAPSDDTVWHTRGGKYIGSRILRAVTHDEWPDSAAWATVASWLPAHASDFINSNDQPAALWRVVFDDAAVGCEDLEEHEIDEAVAAAARENSSVCHVADAASDNVGVTSPSPMRARSVT